MDSDLKRQEEAKRERCWDARERWAALMAAIRFADAQQPVSRNSKQRCLELQAKHWARAQQEQSSVDE